MKRFPKKPKSLFQSPFRRFSAAHVLLVHGLVVLTGLAPTPLMADMLSTNVGHAIGGAGSPAATPTANPVNTAAATAQAHAHALDMLSRNTMALDAVNTMQQAAREAAASANNLGTNPNFSGQTLPNVPNGLGSGTGGLDINGAPVGANAPTQSVQNMHTTVTIQQTQQQAMLNWNTFNVGSSTTVVFDQSAGGADVGTWIAFNQINDPSGNPTQILGSIQAQGQVYIINQNGIIFGGGSQVDTHAMVASALPLNNNLVTRGLLNNPDSQFLFSADAQAAGNNGPTPAFTPPSVPAFGKIGNVTVQAGAQITAPTSDANVGGRVVLVGPNVTNNGTISTPDGQTILAAGMQVGFAAHNSSDPSLRGLDAYVGDVGSYGGTATNAGLIEAPRGSVIITGSSVNQNGFIDSSTSVAFNGRIDLLANYNAVPNVNYNAADSSYGPPFVYQTGNSTGIVHTGAGSVMQILPEWASTATVVGTELALKSQINLQGLGIYLGVNSVILAPNANIAISAGIWDLVMSSSSGNTDQQFVASTGQIYLDQGATVDVSGSTAVATSLNDYITTVTLHAAELSNSALQRNGSLRGQTVTVDLRQTGVSSDGTVWVGTPLANLTGYLGIIQRNVGQLTLDGGTVSMTAGNSVVMQPGATVNVSSGYQDFSGGNVATTQLVSNGNLVNIAAADPNVAYSGIYTGTTTIQNTSWGTSSTTTGVFASNSHYEAAYSAGGNGGSLQITSPTMALDGSLQGSNIIGPQQLTAAPLLSTLELQFQAQQDIRTPQYFPSVFPTSPAISFQNGPSNQVAVGSFALDASGAPLSFPAQRVSTVILSPDLLGGTQGFGSLSIINSNGNITVPADVTLTAAPTGSITLSGANVDVEGQLSAPGGSLSLTAYNISPSTTAYLLTQPPVVVVPTANGLVTIGSSAVLSTAGLVVDNRTTAAAPMTLPTQVAQSVTSGTTTYASSTKGGSIQIQGYSVETDAGSLLNVSGGLVADRAFTFGNAGSLSILAGNDPVFTSLLGGHLSLAGSLQGYSGASGGSLTLQAPVIQVGGTATYAGTLLLQPDFFSTGGFSQFTLSGLGVDITPSGGALTSSPAVIIAPGTLLQPVVSTLTANSITVGTTSSIVLGTTVLAEGYRSPVKLSFLAPGIKGTLDSQLHIRGNITVGAGSQIITDALGTVNLQAQTIEILGQITAPAGTVSIKGAGHYADLTTDLTALATVHLGAASVISTAGKTVYLADPFNRTVGTVYAGGSIQVSGNIVADAGAVLNVSGTSAVLDLTPQQAGMSLAALDAISQALNASYSVPTRVDSNGGTITLKGSEFLYTQATLMGSAGGPTAQGGSLVVSSGLFIQSGSPVDDKDFSLQVAQDVLAIAQPVFTNGAVLGQSLVTAGGAAITGQGYFGSSAFQNGGFDSLTLSGNVQFNGAVNLSANSSLHIADGGVLGADALVSLTAPYVALGRPLMAPTQDSQLLDPYQLTTSNGSTYSNFGPAFGTGRLVVNADLIEAGFLSLQNIGSASLTAQQDLRGNGYVDIAGALTITAGQVYPTTASTFTITAYDYTSGGSTQHGSVTILSSGLTPQFPLSGGGRLNIFASTIMQDGTLRAPLGTITLGWDGTGTAPVGLVSNVAVPVTQQITLKSGSTTSVSAIDPLTGAGVQIPYGIILNGTSWIDPTGLDITSSGPPGKAILISSLNLTTEAGSAIDIRGGGNLFGYQWVTGNGGTVDILASTSSFAIIPGFSALAAPFSPYSTTSTNAANLGGDLGYSNASLKVGEKIYLNASPLNAAGSYTLLPARYALLPGALLITPSSGTPTDSVVIPSGAALTSGYMFNGLNPAVSGSLFQQFEVTPQSVVNTQAQYNQYLATDFIPAQQQSLSLTVTPTPYDAGYALLSAQQTMQISGSLEAAGYSTGKGGSVDINSPLDIVLALSTDIASLNAANQASPVKKLILDTSLLDGWNAGSLLVGGRRSFGTSTTTINVGTNNLTLNAGAALSGNEVILAASQTLTLAAGSRITQSGTQSAADALVTNGNGALVRVSGVATAQTSRTGVTNSGTSLLQVAPGVTVSGPSITLDSSNSSALDNSTVLSGQTINLSSGRISLLLTHPGSLQPIDNGSLVLGGTALAGLQTSSSLSLTSYSAISLYGDTSGSPGGTLSFSGNLALHAGEIRGVNTSGGNVSLSAQALQLDNSASGTVATPGGTSGNLSLTAAKITIGQNSLTVNQFANVTLNASNGILMQGSGAFSAQGNLTAVTPFFTASSNASQNLAAGQVLTLSSPVGSTAQPTALGLGAQFTLTGSSVVENTALYLPSGLITLHALTGNITVGGVLNASGTAQTFFDAVRYTDAGAVQLNADLGNVILSAGSSINLSASGSGNAGSFGVSAPYGSFTVPTTGTLYGMAGGTGSNGSATLDVTSIVAAPKLTAYATLNTALTNGNFSTAQNIRLRSGSVTIDGTVTASSYLLSVDQGSITVNGTINAAGQTGGTIQLISNGDLTLSGGSLLTVAGQTFNDAGKGGSISLESGAAINGVVGSGYVNILANSTLDFSVAAKVAGDVTTVGSSAFMGEFSGTLHIRAPQTAGPNFIQVNAIQGTLKDPSNLVIEGYKLYTTAQANAIIQVSTGTTTTTGAIAGATWKAATLKADASAFFGTNNANYYSMFSRLVSGNAGIMALENQLQGGVVMIEPGIELDNTQGSITLGSNTLTSASSSAYLNDWDLASYRFGPKSSPGVLTIRADNNLVFYNALSDGFQVPTTGNGPERMWLAPLMALSTDPNTGLLLKPVNDQSWSFRLVAGADFTAANFRAVLPGSLQPIAAGSTVAPAPAGSLLLGKNAFNGIGGNSGGGTGALTRLAINPTGTAATTGYSEFQVIRTGTGDIDIAVGGDVRLQNQFASIYTAGAQVPSGTTVFTAGDFVTPSVTQTVSSNAATSQNIALGVVQQLYPAQFSMAGGNVSVSALNDILHTTTDQAGDLLMDSERELPNNWLMRRDYVNSSGNYGTITDGTGGNKINDTSASTAWWINFSNFFDGVAALGGGNVTLKAGRDVQNVDASTPTNARAAQGAATSTNLRELGGGDLLVQTGRNIDGGIYYVERGTGLLLAGAAITTNATRAPGTGTLSGGTPTPDQLMADPSYQNTWLPTTLFVGNSSFNVSARGNVLLGPVANTTLLPQGLTNRPWYKTYFSTYADGSSLTASSLGGNVSFRLEANTPDQTQPQKMLTLWMENELEMQNSSSAYFLPWLRVLEGGSSGGTNNFDTLSGLFPANLHATAFSGDINVVGNLTLAPSATGSLELLAAGAINGLQPTGVSSQTVAGAQTIAGVETTLWASSTVNLSDADPKAIPSFTAPLSYYGILLSDPTLKTASSFNNALNLTNSTFLNNLDALFAETGSTTGASASTQSKQTLHAKGLLHANDTKPVLLYAKGGSLSGLTLFSAKKAVILAQQDITDIALYIQNVNSTDVSIVSSGRDIVAYDANSVLRSLAVSPGNYTATGVIPNAGDIQISGPGSLQVLTGRNLNLGTGTSNSDGTGAGITSIGNGRNPYLPFTGADILLAAGMGQTAVGLAGTNADWTTFITQFATSPAGSRYLAELAAELGVPSINLNDPTLTQAQQRELALAIYFLVLRDAGRDHNDPNSPNVGTYAAGNAAIATLFPTISPGSIQTQTRDVRTKSGGNISILAPDGGVQLAPILPASALTAPPGVITEDGGSISVFTNNSVNIGVSRIFTLKGGDITIWSSNGDIAAGSSSKTVQSAPPTRVLIDPQSANVTTDLAGLATGGGIGVLATVVGVPPGNVDLIAPKGAVDAGDAGIRATGNLNIAATVVLNAANISVGGTSSGTPAAASVSAPSLGGVSAAGSSAGAATTAVSTQASAQSQPQQALSQDQPSIITVEVLGYGGGGGTNDDLKRNNDQPGE